MNHNKIFFKKFAKNIEIFNPVKEDFYKMPTRAIVGRGALNYISNFLDENKRIVLVISEHFKNTAEYRKLMKNLLKKTNEIIVFNENIIETNTNTLNILIEFCRNKKPDLIIAIGGGTIVDAGKCAAIMLKNKGKIEDYVIGSKKLEKQGANLIAIPTTAGTGSEVTPWATVWDKSNRKKYSLSSPLMFPYLAIVDSCLIDKLPAKISAETGMDALAQAIEAYWSLNHNRLSDVFALEAIQLIMSNLEKSVNDPTNESRDKMAKASLLTGLAFSNTKTTICHSISYPITAHFNISHGQAVAITLPLFIEYIFPILEKGRVAKLLGSLESSNERESAKKIALLMNAIGLKTKLSELGIKRDDIELIVKEGYSPERVSNSPKIPTKIQLKEMLNTIY